MSGKLTAESASVAFQPDAWIGQCAGSASCDPLILAAWILPQGIKPLTHGNHIIAHALIPLLDPEASVDRGEGSPWWKLAALEKALQRAEIA